MSSDEQAHTPLTPEQALLNAIWHNVEDISLRDVQDAMPGILSELHAAGFTITRRGAVTISMDSAHKINRWMIEHVVAGDPTDPGYDGHTELVAAIRAAIAAADPEEETDVREKAARAAFDAFYVEGTPYSQIERAIFLQVADAVIATITRRGAVTSELRYTDADMNAVYKAIQELALQQGMRYQWFFDAMDNALIEHIPPIAVATPDPDEGHDDETGYSSEHPIPTDAERDEVHRYLREKYAPDAATPDPDEEKRNA